MIKNIIFFISKFKCNYCCTGQDVQLEIFGCYFVTVGRMWINDMKVTFVVFGIGGNIKKKVGRIRVKIVVDDLSAYFALPLKCFGRLSIP